MRNIISLYRNAYSGLSRESWLLSLIMLVNRMGTMVLPFMSLYLTKGRHFSLSAAGLVITLFGAGGVLGSFLGGRLTDKFGFARVQLIALVSGGILFIVLGQLSNYTAICICTFILSCVNETFRPANAAAIAQYSKPENRTRSYSLNRLAINLGWALGSSLGGLLAAYNYGLLFIIDGCTNMLSALAIILLLPPDKVISTSGYIRHEVLQTVQSAYKDKRYMIFICCTFLFAYCFFQWFTTVPVFYKDGLHLGENVYGMVMAVNGLLIAGFEMVAVHSMEGRRAPLTYICIGTLLTAVSFVLFNVSIIPSITLAFATMLLCTVGEIFAMPFMNTYWTSRCNDTNRGQYAGLYSMAWSGAHVAAPVTGSYVAEHLGYSFLWYMICAFCLLSLIGYRMLAVFGLRNVHQSLQQP